VLAGGCSGSGRAVKGGVTTSVRVQIEALSLLLRNGAWVREELSAYVCFVIVCMPRVWVPLLARVQQLAL
jgi:hypothetical protein